MPSESVQFKICLGYTLSILVGVLFIYSLICTNLENRRSIKRIQEALSETANMKIPPEDTGGGGGKPGAAPLDDMIRMAHSDVLDSQVTKFKSDLMLRDPFDKAAPFRSKAVGDVRSHDGSDGPAKGKKDKSGTVGAQIATIIGGDSEGGKEGTVKKKPRDSKTSQDSADTDKDEQIRDQGYNNRIPRSPRLKQEYVESSDEGKKTDEPVRGRNRMSRSHLKDDITPKGKEDTSLNRKKRSIKADSDLESESRYSKLAEDRQAGSRSDFDSKILPKTETSKKPDSVGVERRKPVESERQQVRPRGASSENLRSSRTSLRSEDKEDKDTSKAKIADKDTLKGTADQRDSIKKAIRQRPSSSLTGRRSREDMKTESKAPDENFYDGKPTKKEDQDLKNAGRKSRMDPAKKIDETPDDLPAHKKDLKASGKLAEEEGYDRFADKNNLGQTDSEIEEPLTARGMAAAGGEDNQRFKEKDGEPQVKEDKKDRLDQKDDKDDQSFKEEGGESQVKEDKKDKFDRKDDSSSYTTTTEEMKVKSGEHMKESEPDAYQAARQEPLGISSVKDLSEVDYAQRRVSDIDVKPKDKDEKAIMLPRKQDPTESVPMVRDIKKESDDSTFKKDSDLNLVGSGENKIDSKTLKDDVSDSKKIFKEDEIHPSEDKVFPGDGLLSDTKPLDIASDIHILRDEDSKLAARGPPSQTDDGLIKDFKESIIVKEKESMSPDSAGVDDVIKTKEPHETFDIKPETITGQGSLEDENQIDKSVETAGLQDMYIETQKPIICPNAVEDFVRCPKTGICPGKDTCPGPGTCPRSKCVTFARETIVFSSEPDARFGPVCPRTEIFSRRKDDLKKTVISEKPSRDEGDAMDDKKMASVAIEKLKDLQLDEGGPETWERILPKEDKLKTSARIHALREDPRSMDSARSLVVKQSVPPLEPAPSLDINQQDLLRKPEDDEPRYSEQRTADFKLSLEPVRHQYDPEKRETGSKMIFEAKGKIPFESVQQRPLQVKKEKDLGTRTDEEIAKKSDPSILLKDRISLESEFENLVKDAQKKRMQSLKSIDAMFQKAVDTETSNKNEAKFATPFEDENLEDLYQRASEKGYQPIFDNIRTPFDDKYSKEFLACNDSQASDQHRDLQKEKRDPSGEKTAFKEIPKQKGITQEIYKRKHEVKQPTFIEKDLPPAKLVPEGSKKRDIEDPSGVSQQHRPELQGFIEKTDPSLEYQEDDYIQVPPQKYDSQPDGKHDPSLKYQEVSPDKSEKRPGHCPSRKLPQKVAICPGKKNKFHILQKYPQDRTINFAAIELGARIHRVDAEPIRKPSFVQSMFGLKYVQNPPVFMIDQSLQPGKCFAFSSKKATVVIELANEVYISGVAIEHISKTPNNSIKNAPKDFKVYGAEMDETPNTFLGEFSFEITDEGRQYQVFDVKKIGRKLKYVTIIFISNHGDPETTCVYRVAIFGHK